MRYNCYTVTLNFGHLPQVLRQTNYNFSISNCIYNYYVHLLYTILVLALII